MAHMETKPFTDDQAVQIICALISAGRIRTIGTLDTRFISDDGRMGGHDFRICMTDEDFTDSDISGRDAHYLRALFHELTRPQE